MAAATLAHAGCGGDTTDTGQEPPASLVGASAAEQFPAIVAVDATYDASADTWSFAVTVSSPYDTPERYADGWRVVGPDGTVLGVHRLTHDHADEQPFTRTQTGVEIPHDVDEVTVEGRDLVNGFGGETRTIELEAGTS
jgi:hypothetical protein